MDCSCTVDIGAEDNLPGFSSKEMRTARKKHVCSECQREILPGEKYEHVAGMWDGEFDRFKTCQGCISVREQFFRHGYYYGMVWEDLAVFIHQAEGNIPERCIAALTLAARDRVCCIIERVWDETDEG